MNDFLKITRNGRILEIVIDRPKANTLDAPLSREMGKVFADFRDDPELRVAILTGAGGTNAPLAELRRRGLDDFEQRLSVERGADRLRVVGRVGRDVKRAPDHQSA